jgi:hypothetical protein
MKLQKLFFAAVIVLSANAAFAQTPLPAVTTTHNVNISIPEVALLDVVGAGGSHTASIDLAGTAPSIAGEQMTFGPAATNSTIWMNYSSIIKSGSLRNVTVTITTGSVPAGLKLTVLAGDVTSGKGTKGTAASAITFLNSTDLTIPQNIFTGIGSVYTEAGNGKGSNLTYTLGSDGADYGSLDLENSASLVISYTLSDII